MDKINNYERAIVVINKTNVAGYKLNTARIKGMMAERGMTQKSMANLLMIAVSSVNNKLKGKTSFTATELCALADEFKKDPSVFFAP